jgi:hypothetical protein
MLVGKDHPPRLVKLAKLEFKWVIRGSFLICALSNIGHGFEYIINEGTELPPGFNTKYTFSDYTYLSKKSYISQYPTVTTYHAFIVYSVFYFVVNFGFFFAINTLIEIQIVQRMRKELKEKRVRMLRMSSGKSLITSNSSVSSTITNRLTSIESEDEKKERRVIVMVVVNSVMNFVLRFPDFLIFLEATGNSYVIYLNLLYPGFSALLLHISYLSYILTFSCNFVIFYQFNSKFKEAFIGLFKKNA